MSLLSRKTASTASALAIVATIASLGVTINTAFAQGSSDTEISTKNVTNADIQELMKSLKKQKSELEKQRKAISEQQQKLMEQQRSFEEQMRRFSALETKFSSVTGETIGAEKTPPQNNSEASDQDTTTVGIDRKQEEVQPEITALADTGGVLLGRGKLVIEPSLAYSNSSAVRVDVQGFTIQPTLVIGGFEIVDVKRDTLTASLTTRYGITDRLEVDVSVPYLYRSDRTTTRPFGTASTSDVITDLSASEIGDIAIGAHYQINDGNDGWPFLVGNLRFKTTTGTGPFEVPVDAESGAALDLPTGTGFYSIEPSLTAILPSDPVVFFGNIGYQYNIEDDTRLGTVDPGDAIVTSFGMGLSLNEKAGVSLSYNHDTVFETEVNGEKLPGSTLLQLGTLTFASSYKVSDNTSFNLSVGAGVTEDASDLSVQIRVPIKFDLLK